MFTYENLSMIFYLTVTYWPSGQISHLQSRLKDTFLSIHTEFFLLRVELLSFPSLEVKENITTQGLVGIIDEQDTVTIRDPYIRLIPSVSEIKLC